jgi:hypothetical protein
MGCEYEVRVTDGKSRYNVVKAPIGWSLFCDHERVGGYVSSEAVLAAATQRPQMPFEKVSQHSNALCSAENLRA